MGSCDCKPTDDCRHTKPYKPMENKINLGELAYDAEDVKVAHLEASKLFNSSSTDGRSFQECYSIALNRILAEKIGDTIKNLELEREALKAEMLMSIGEAEKCLGDGYSITAGLVGPAQVSYERQGYRQFRVNWSKKK